MQPADHTQLCSSLRWQIRLFGSLRITDLGSAEHDVKRKKAGEIVAYLALHPGQLIPRDKLLAAVWADSDVADTRTRLRQEILRLKTMFAPNDCPIVVTSGDCLKIQDNSLTDAIQFRQACEQWKTTNNIAERCRLFESACANYTADLLVDYDALWIVAERARLAAAFEELAREHAENCRERGDYSAAEDALLTLLSRNPEQEEDHAALMRLYAEWGLPTRVQRQATTMARALRAEPDPETIATVNSLAERLKREASLRVGEQYASVGPATHVVPNTTPHVTQDCIGAADLPTRGRKGWISLPAVIPIVLVLVAVAAGLRHSPKRSVLKKTAAIHHNLHKWLYCYAPGRGEVANSEAKAISSDHSGIYATGFIETDHDDVDILTVKLRANGAPLWTRRYSSPEHDCDRAYSICACDDAGVYVAGETYVPDRAGIPGSWRLVVLKYSPQGKFLWARRSPEPTQNDGHRIQVVPDGLGGCIAAGTALDGKRVSPLLLRYSGDGGLLWHRTLKHRNSASFYQMAISHDRRIYVCGDVRYECANVAAISRWRTVCIDLNGATVWDQVDMKMVKGNNSAQRILLDASGKLYIGGYVAFATRGGNVPTLRIEKRDSDGILLWQGILEGTECPLLLDAMALDLSGNVAIGGTEYKQDGTNGILLARFNAFGNQVQLIRQQLPGGYRSAKLSDMLLSNDQHILVLGQATPGNSATLQENSSILFAETSPGQFESTTWLYDFKPGSPNVCSGLTITPFGDTVACGQSSLDYKNREFLILCR